MSSKKPAGWSSSAALHWLLRLASIPTVILVWYLITAAGIMSSFILPDPFTVANAGIRLGLTGQLARHVASSLSRIALGFLIAALTAVPVGIVLGWSNIARRSSELIVEIVRPIPAIALVPLAIIWFGIGEESKIFVIWFGAFWPILLNTYSGIRFADPLLVRAALSLGANMRQILFRVALRSAFPSILTGLKLGLWVAFAVIVAAEMIAAGSGLGFLIADARKAFRADVVIVGMLVIGLVGALLNQGIDRVLRIASRESSRIIEGE